MSAVDTRVVAQQSRVAQALEEHGTLVIVVGAFALVMIVALRHALVVDGWLALVSGRWIAHHGLPAHDTLAVWSHGRTWIDQQWLAQLTFYGVWSVGGVAMLLLLHATLALAAVVIAASLSLRLGASSRSTAWVGVAVVIAYYPVASVARPQSFAYPLFAATMWLVCTDARAPSRRIYAALPLLVLWANLHGSVVLGAALVSLAGVVRRSPVLLLAPWACVFATPYALHLPTYYRAILIDGDFKHFVTEWAPTTLTASTAAVYAVALGGMWLIGRAPSRLTATDKLVFLFAVVLAFQAVRNTGWLGLAALGVLPTTIDAIRRPAVEPRRLNRLLATSVLAGIAVAVTATALKPATWFEESFPPDAARAAAGPGLVYASSPYADWLLWSRPELAGRVAYDARFELLTRAQLRSIAVASPRTLRAYDTFVLDPRADARLVGTVERRLHARTVFVDPHVIVLRSS